MSVMLGELWIYDPWDDSVIHGPDFDTARAAHASWYVPGLGTEGYLCIAGGATDGVTHLRSTQCYNVASGSWHAENADPSTPLLSITCSHARRRGFACR
jgi:hypothetical protein